jgi:membrane protease YdiL (CAAX protease family)
MSAPNSAPQRVPTARSPLRRLVARYPVVSFLVMAFVFSWTIMLPLLLSESGFGVLPFALPWQVFGSLMSVFGLALPAFLVTAIKDGEEGVRDLLSRVFRWRVGGHWYLLALFGLLVVTLLGALPFLGVAPLGSLARNWSLIFTVFLPGVLVPFVLVNLWEETAWTGFMQHTLQGERGPLLASILVAPFFALIHMPGFFVAGFISDEKTPLSQFPAVLVQVGILAVFAVFVRVLIMWLYNGSGRSVLIAGLFHSAFNMTNGQKITPDLLGLPEGLASLIPAVAVIVLAVMLVVFTRGRLAYEPGRSAAAQPAEAGGFVASQQRMR